MEKDFLLNLRKFLIPEIVYGEGARLLAGHHAGNMGATRVMVVTDSGIQSAGIVSQVEESLQSAGISYIVFDDITPNPKDREVMAGAEVCRKESCDLIIAVGGGSPMDCAKGIGVVVGNPGHILDFEGVDEVPNPGPPLIFIPTTAGSSADVSQFAIINDTGRKVKIAIVSKMVIPDLALVDPEATRSMPPHLTAETGMDALCHALEAFVSNAASPLTDMAALSAVRLIAENLPGAFHEPDNMVFRDNMMMASLMAGLAFSNASLGMVHAMAHSLGGAFDLPHGECNAILLERAVKFNYPDASEKYDRLADAMGMNIGDLEPDQRAAGLSAGLSSLREKLSIPKNFADTAASPSDIATLVDHALNDPCMATNPRRPTAGDVERIYREIFQS
jgi:alcohol dehydrogenase class IV